MKEFAFTERVNLSLGGQVQNVFNHQNLAPPSSLIFEPIDSRKTPTPNPLDMTSNPNFGRATATQNSDNAGPRAASLTARLAF
jgi:hypothetical protein